MSEFGVVCLHTANFVWFGDSREDAEAIVDGDDDDYAVVEFDDR